MFASAISSKFHACRAIALGMCLVVTGSAGCVSSTATPATAAAKPAPALTQAKAAPNGHHQTLMALALSEPDMAVFIDMKAMTTTDGYRKRIERRAPGLAAKLQNFESQCEASAFESIDQVLLTRSGGDIAIAATLRISKDEVVRCAKRLMGAETKPWQSGRYHGIQFEGAVLVTHDNWMLMATQDAAPELLDRVERKRGPARRDLPALKGVTSFSRMPLNDGSGVARFDTVVKTDGDNGSLVFTLYGATTFSTDVLVNGLRSRYSAALRDAVGGFEHNGAPLHQRWDKRPILRTVGNGVEIRLPFQDDDTYWQGAETLSSQLLGHARRHLLSERARYRIQRLGLAVKKVALTDADGGQPRLRYAAPPTSDQGAKGGGNEWQHATWTKYDFAVSDGDPFAYEIIVRNSRKALIRASADTDEDGQPSVFELPVTVAGKHVSLGSVHHRGDSE